MSEGQNHGSVWQTSQNRSVLYATCREDSQPDLSGNGAGLMETSHRIVDVTDMSPAAFDAFLSVACGEDFVDASDLNREERRQVAEALGWPNDSRTHAWINSFATEAPWVKSGTPKQGRVEV